MKAIINKEHISNIEIFLDKICHRYTYKEEREFLFHKKKEGFYHSWDDKRITVLEIQNDPELVCRGKKVYYKPYIIIYIDGKVVYNKFFSTKEKLNTYLNEIFRGVDTIIVFENLKYHQYKE